MKTIQSLCTLVLGLIGALSASAQTDSAAARQKALFYADSLIRSHFYQDWKAVASLTCNSAIKYYGGPDGFREHVVMLYFHNEPQVEEKPERSSIVRIMNNDIDEWQCVVEKIRHTFINNRRARIYSYLVGQSKDDAATWKFVDVSHNSVKNVIYIFPDIFGTLAIPDARTVYEDEELAAQLAAEEAANKKEAVPKKKPAPVKKKK
ncbi:MAG: hypothetical protein P0Y53_22800 [Candidatus Pseudobacter hemicellulosilyticus]|uniref:SnoaL-like protein n=1 Tax=Candidatus Pseudobacter hemicellulosilyticus TaxID=3121375 RepID=A0AAJ6BHM1_9BACT|nr:MAG: hypothetical protein P0Y53_22800 [Pseudobacter sp.]